MPHRHPHRHPARTAVLPPAIPFDAPPAFGEPADPWAVTTPSAFDARPLDPNNAADWRALGWSHSAAAELASSGATIELAEPALPHGALAQPPAISLPPEVRGTAQVARHHWGRVMHAPCMPATTADVIALRGSMAARELAGRTLAQHQATCTNVASAERVAAQLRASHATSANHHYPAARRDRLFADSLWASLAVGSMLLVGLLAGIAAGAGWLDDAAIYLQRAGIVSTPGAGQ